MISYIPRQVDGKLTIDLDSMIMTFTNEQDKFVTLCAESEQEKNSFRAAWKLATVDLMHENGFIDLIRKGSRYSLYYDCGFWLELKDKERRYLKIWARPFTPHHARYCIDRKCTMREAVKAIKMTSEAFKMWNRKLRFSHRSEG